MDRDQLDWQRSVLLDHRLVESTHRLAAILDGRQSRVHRGRYGEYYHLDQHPVLPTDPDRPWPGSLRRHGHDIHRPSEEFQWNDMVDWQNPDRERQPDHPSDEPGRRVRDRRHVDE